MLDNGGDIAKRGRASKSPSEKSVISQHKQLSPRLQLRNAFSVRGFSAKTKWSGWQELNRRAHSPKTCRWRLRVFPRLLPLGEEVHQAHSQEGRRQARRRLQIRSLLLHRSL